MVPNWLLYEIETHQTAKTKVDRLFTSFKPFHKFFGRGVVWSKIKEAESNYIHFRTPIYIINKKKTGILYCCIWLVPHVNLSQRRKYFDIPFGFGTREGLQMYPWGVLRAFSETVWKPMDSNFKSAFRKSFIMSRMPSQIMRSTT